MNSGTFIASFKGVENIYKAEIEKMGIWGFGSNYVHSVRKTFGMHKGENNYNKKSNQKLQFNE